MRISHIQGRLEQQHSLSTLIVRSLESFTQIPTIELTSRLSPSEQELIRNHPYFTDNIHSTTYERYLECVDRMNAHLDSEEQLKEGFILINHHQKYYAQFCRKTAISKGQLDRNCLSFTEEYVINSRQLSKAWDDLISFYENKRLLVNAAIQALLSLRRMTRESATDLEYLYTNLMQIFRTLETLQRPVDKWDDFLVFLAVQRLDSDSVKAWEQHLGSAKEPPTWKQFCEFLVTRLLSLQAFEKSRGIKVTTKAQQNTFKSHFQAKNSDIGDTSSSSCIICSSKHYLAKCPQYISKTTQQRYSILTKHGRCYNCLGAHRVSDCHSTKRCIKCGRKHHTTIHKQPSLDKQVDSTKATTPQETVTKSSSSQVLHLNINSTHATSCVLLATAQVVIINQKGSTLQIRALIDQGSEITLITERVAQNLKLSRSHSWIPLVELEDTRLVKPVASHSFKIAAIYENSETLEVSAHILPKLTNSIPSVSIDMHQWQHLIGLTLADPHFLQPLAVDMIIGADVYHQIIREGLKKGPIDSPIAQLTAFGWIISGPTSANRTSLLTNSYHASMDQQLFDVLRKFWEQQEVCINKSSSLSPEEQACEKHFQDTHSRDPQGRYVVSLPFKRSAKELGPLNSRHKAARMLTSLWNKFNSDTIYAQAYSKFMTEYKDLHHMRLIDDIQPEPQPNFYLPHHGVWKENSTTTKLRVVFNGSSRTTSRLSLNDILHTGPKLQLELLDISKRCIARSISIQRTGNTSEYYGSTSEDHVDTYELTTVTYGLACAPYLALRTILQLVEDEKMNYPLAIPCLTKGRYVDDVFGGAESIEALKAQVVQLNQLCLAGGFQLQKWTSNLDSILDSLPRGIRDDGSSKFIDRTSCVQVLGLNWHPQSDTFHFILNPPTSHSITKRAVLSLIAKLFDPLGLLSPIIIKAKILIQELWTQRLDWDDPLPTQFADKWETFLSELSDINLIHIPRWIGSKPEQQIQIHGFCDASQQAFAASVYLRTTNAETKSTAMLIVSKTKVAPLKRLTIPRLELSGAVLLTKLVSHILSVLDLKGVSVFLWTDSSVTLTWINGSASKWTDFVHNRVVYIQETLLQARWRFVSGKENPADIATRGVSPSQLNKFTCWWEGPTWLSQSPDTWPVDSDTVSTSDNLEERPAQITTVTSGQISHPWDLLARYSDLKKLLRITAMCMRAAERFRQSVSLTNPLTVCEIDKARMFWIKHIQQIYFKQEISVLSGGATLPKSSPLTRLTPFLDANDLLRTGGRLQHSSLPEDSKHLLILPKQSLFTVLIISDAHLKTLHGGTQITLTHLRQNYWIVGGTGKNEHSRLWANFQKKRVNPTIRPFFNSGVDYAGPFSIKTWKGKNARQYKAYIAVFVCYSTSASHLELVTDYSSDAFIAAYKRFAARRGICATLSSDCGTNLMGADKELRNLFSASSKESDKLLTLLANDGTQWIFNPPSAPHFGGKWEATVKSVKHHLKRIVGNQLLTYEEMTTLLSQIEAVLNSRPLSPLSDDPEDLSALTPGHFLVGGAPTIIPEPMLNNVNCSRLSRWQLLKQMLDTFWSRWSQECLQRFHDVSKWNKPVPSLKKDSLVLVVDERYPPAKWPLGRVIDVHPGADGHVRVVTVRTQTSVLKRPIVKLCPLPIERTDS
ncbi:uncharacterized protein LOC112639446 [Camponotus floridanus]|uniref:uncharacterized protein LOC112639446 n=1 Tax=Camponotus floridanus TaxID=104421 RepID=UPI000DC66E69|nr:uncharacterized protein LOC112639446 [Camponotus floridanus]